MAKFAYVKVGEFHAALLTFVQLLNQERELGYPATEAQWIEAHDKAKELINGIE